MGIWIHLFRENWRWNLYYIRYEKKIWKLESYLLQCSTYIVNWTDNWTCTINFSCSINHKNDLYKPTLAKGQWEKGEQRQLFFLGLNMVNYCFQLRFFGIFILREAYHKIAYQDSVCLGTLRKNAGLILFSRSCTT